MKIIINGNEQNIPNNINLKDLIKYNLKLKPQTVIAEVNEKIVKKDHWENAILCDGDSIELINFVGGG